MAKKKTKKTTKKRRTASRSVLHNRLRRHFGADPRSLTIVQERFSSYERANLHLAIQDTLAELDAPHELLGVVVPDEWNGVTLSKLSDPKLAAHFAPGPVEHLDVKVATGQLSCVRRGLHLLRDRGDAFAVLLFDDRHSPMEGEIVMEVLGAQQEAETFARRLTRAARYGKALRGNILSVEVDCYSHVSIQFHHLPPVARTGIVLPDAVLRRIERHTFGFTRHAERLAAAGRHLKRGILLHGPPGTGKTLCAMYLASQMKDRTVLLITGMGMGAIEHACRLARMLLPATIILEDVDLVGTERNYQTVSANAILFELMNQMDGLAEDADVLFVLTTNRPDILEPALASRPGRIDQAIAIPLPDLDCRHRLLQLYSSGLQVAAGVLQDAAGWTEGASGALIRELLRKAALFAADEDPGQIAVTKQHLEQALAELLIGGGQLTQSLLGSKIKPGESCDA